MLRRILVPLDGSSRAERALPIASQLAHATGSHVLLLRVVNLPALHSPAMNPPRLLLAPVSVRLSSARRYLRNAARRAGLTRVNIETEAVEGPIVETILEVADSTNADLIVMCSHGHTGALHWPLGSVARDVARHGDIPTLVVRAHGSLQPGIAGAARPTALIALDGTPYAERAIGPALDLLEALTAPGQAEAHLISVCASLSANELTHYLQGVADELRRSRLAGGAVSVTWSLGLGDDPVHALATAARGDGEREAPAFIALATHARTGWQRWVNGSVTESLLDATTTPLLITGPSAPVSSPAKKTEPAIPTGV